MPYADTRAGGLSYAAPACATMTTPLTATVWVTGLPYGTLLSDHITVRPEPPARFAVIPSADTLATGDAARITAVAVTADGAETVLDPDTPVTLSAAGGGYLTYQRWGSSNTTSGPAITVPYRGARGQDADVFVVMTGDAPEHDTALTISVAGGGISGDTTLVRLGRLRLDLTASPDALPNGGASRLYATIRGSGASVVPPNATLTFTLADSSLGTLYRRSTQQWGTSITGVSRLDAAQGDVVFNRDCSGPASPGGTAHITSAVDGWATLFDSRPVAR